MNKIAGFNEVSMTILSDRDLRKLIERGNIYVEEGPEIEPEVQLGPSSLDMRLGYEFGIVETRRI